MRDHRNGVVPTGGIRPGRNIARSAALALRFARLITDSNIRSSIVAMAQKWLDLADRESGQPEALDRAACLRDLQTKIGQELRAQYDLQHDLPHRMLTLLMQLDDKQDRERGGAIEPAS